MKTSTVKFRCEIVEVFSALSIVQMVAIFTADFLKIATNSELQFLGFLVYFFICSLLYGIAPRLSIINKNLNEGTTEKVCN